MVFLLVTTSIMAVSIFLIYKLTNHFGFRMKYRSLILCAVMAFLVNISAIMLSPYLTQAHYLRLIVLVIGAAAIVTIYNERLVCREAHAADGNAAMVQQEEEEPLPSRLSAAMERLLHLAKRISKKPSAEPAATAPKKRMTIIAADPVPVVSEEALPAARSEAEPQPDDKPVSDIKKDKAAAPAEPTAAPSQKNAPKAAVVKQETAEPTDSATTKTAVATKKTTGPKTTATAATTPATEKPAATKPAEAKPAPAKTEATKPVAAKPVPAKTEATKPVAAKPVPAKPEATKPSAAKSASVKPEATKPSAAKPASAKPEATKPAAAKPVPAKLEATKPVAAKPVPAKPEVAKSAAAKPVPAKPTAAKPVATNATKTKPVTPAAIKPVVEKPANAKTAAAKSSASKPVAAKPPAAQATPAKTAVSKPTIPKSVAVNPALAKTVPPKIVTEVSNLSSMDDILDFAYSHKDQGNISEAVFAYKQALKRYRKDSYAPFLAIELGNIYKEQAAYDEAILTYADALTIPAIADDDATYQEFTKNLSYLRTVKYILSKHDALTVPFQKIPNDYMKEIETEFQTRHAQA